MTAALDFNPALFSTSPVWKEAWKEAFDWIADTDPEKSYTFHVTNDSGPHFLVVRDAGLNDCLVIQIDETAPDGHHLERLYLPPEVCRFIASGIGAPR